MGGSNPFPPNPSKLLPTKLAHAAPVEENTARPKPVPSKPTSVSVGGTSAKTTQKPANHAITYACQNVHVANNIWIGHSDAHGLAKMGGIDGPLNQLSINTGALVEIDLTGALKANILSNLELMMPDFTEDVGHQSNSTILSKTADLTVHEINDNPPDIVLKLYSSVPLKHTLLYEFTKMTVPWLHYKISGTDR
ncbi:hypothetical protein JB92DRAFT_3136036 [Gautieria morchelliformis]|nr:hypothetical protein JB92DRAFT_3136036 [Gautieria morchelliformis]